MNFKPKTQNELHGLPDEELIEYLVAARDADRPDQMELAVSFAIFRYEGKIRAMAFRKGIEGHDQEQLVGDVLESAFKAATSFAGTHVGEFVNWIKTITSRRIADFHEKRERSRADVSLDIGDNHDEWGPPEPSESDWVESSTIKSMRDELLSELSEAHRAVVVSRLAGVSSKETAAKVNESPDIDEAAMTPGNVDKIFSRFGKDFEKRYRSDGD